MAVKAFVAGLCEIGWLGGPIMDKEFRVASRRRRTYVLRFAYIVALGLFLALMWRDDTSGGPSQRMVAQAEFAQDVAISIAWFQFLAAQVLAVTMLSAGFTADVNKRTLGILLTTPITPLQVVFGKLLSRLLSMFLLFAVSVPILAALRVFGGVPWAYLFCSACMTVCAAVFAGAVALRFSLGSRAAHVAMGRALVTLFFAYCVPPIIVSFRSWDMAELAFYYLNPLVAQEDAMLTALYGGRSASLYYWPGHCAVMLGLATLALHDCAARVRSVAAQMGTPARRKAFTWGPLGAVWRFLLPPPDRIRPVRGPAIFWRETNEPARSPLSRPRTDALLTCPVLAFLVVFGWLIGVKLMSTEPGAMAESMAILLPLMLLTLAPRYAARIAGEREKRTWPILLTTPLSDWDIVRDKTFVGVFHSAVVLIMLELYVLVPTLAGTIHPVLLLHLAIIFTGASAFVCCVGLHASTLSRTTLTATILCIAGAALTWVAVPVIVLYAFPDSLGTRLCIDMNPFVQALVVTQAAAMPTNLDKYEWHSMRAGVVPSTCLLIVTMLAHAAVAFVFAWRAKCRLRKRIF